mgnify:CR=1 FL=1
MPIALIAIGSLVALRSPKNSAVVERILDPRLLYSEVDDTLAIPLPTEFRLIDLGVYSIRLKRIFRNDVASPSFTGLRPAVTYFGRVQGRSNACAFVYPPTEMVHKWAVQVRGEVVEAVRFGPVNLTLKSNVYIWRTPVFRRFDDQTQEFKRSGSQIIPGTKLFYNHARTDYAHIGTAVTAPTDHSFPDGTRSEAVEVEFVHGAREWVPAANLTNYFVYR